MKAKNGVDLRDLSAPAWWAAHLADQLHIETAGREMVVTSTGDGKHSVKRSQHYTGGWLGHGRAFDMRVWYLSDPASFADALVRKLGEDYYVLLEFTKDENDKTVPSHIHIHWGPVYK